MVIFKKQQIQHLIQSSIKRNTMNVEAIISHAGITCSADSDSTHRFRWPVCQISLNHTHVSKALQYTQGPTAL